MAPRLAAWMAVACLVFGMLGLGAGAGPGAAGRGDRRGSHGHHPGDRGRGQPAHRGGDDPQLHAGRRSATRSIRQRSISRSRTCSRTGLFDDVALRREGDRAGRQRGREPDHQPHRLRGQPPARRRAADQRGPAPAARGLHALAGAERGQPDPRALSPQRPLRRDRRAQGHRAAAEPRRPRVRDQRGAADRRLAHRLHRQPRLRATATCAA